MMFTVAFYIPPYTSITMSNKQVHKLPSNCPYNFQDSVMTRWRTYTNCPTAHTDIINSQSKLPSTAGVRFATSGEG